MSEPLLTRGAEGVDRRAFTVDDLDAMFAAGIHDREDKIELIRGRLFRWRRRTRRIFG
jgi:hypothetical protein